MPDYQKMYKMLFNAMTDAVRLLQSAQQEKAVTAAIELLQQAQQNTDVLCCKGCFKKAPTKM